jgi:hypothetical protein
VPRIVRKLTLVKQPFFAYFSEVAVVNCFWSEVGLFVVDFACAVELILSPIPFVGDGIVGVIEFTIAFHTVVMPLSFIVTPVQILNPSSSIFHIIVFKSFVLSILACLYDKLSFFVQILVFLFWSFFFLWHFLLYFIVAICI